MTTEIALMIEETIAQFRGLQAEYRQQLDACSGVIALHNTVVRTSPGLYLRPKGNGYGVGGITTGVVLFSPRDAQAQAQAARAVAGAEQSEAVPYVTALRHEIAEIERLIDGLQRKVAA